MPWVLVPSETRVTVEVHAAGLLAAAAHDLRLAAEGATGVGSDDGSDDGAPDGPLTARFPVAGLRVVASRRHGSRDWHDPSPADAADIERRVRTELFSGPAIEVQGSLRDGRAELTVRAPGGSQRLVAPVTVERDAHKLRLRGACELSLRALGTGRVRVPLGAIKLEDGVRVELDVTLTK